MRRWYLPRLLKLAAPWRRQKRVLCEPSTTADCKTAVARTLATFAANDRAATAVEFGLIGLPFLTLLMAIMETGLVFLMHENLDAAVSNAARALQTGIAQASGVTTATQFETSYLCPASGGSILGSFITCSKLIIDVRPNNSLATADVTGDFYKTPSTNEFCPGAPNTIIVMRVAYPMPSFLPLLHIVGPAAGSLNTTGLVNDVPGDPGWKHLLVATSIFQTENYNPTGYTPPPGC